MKSNTELADYISTEIDKLCFRPRYGDRERMAALVLRIVTESLIPQGQTHDSVLELAKTLEVLAHSIDGIEKYRKALGELSD